MIGYVMVGSNNLPKAVEFYDQILTPLGGNKVIETDRLVVWADESGKMFAVCKPYDGQAATVGNGVMVAFNAKDQQQVKDLHAKVLSLGGSDEGEPGDREMLYCGYCRDLDGNKLNFYVMK